MGRVRPRASGDEQILSHVRVRHILLSPCWDQWSCENFSFSERVRNRIVSNRAVVVWNSIELLQRKRRIHNVLAQHLPVTERSVVVMHSNDRGVEVHPALHRIANFVHACSRDLPGIHHIFPPPVVREAHPGALQFILLVIRLHAARLLIVPQHLLHRPLPRGTPGPAEADGRGQAPESHPRLVLVLGQQALNRVRRRNVQVLVEVEEENPLCQKSRPVKTVVDEEQLVVPPGRVQFLVERVRDGEQSRIDELLEQVAMVLAQSPDIVEHEVRFSLPEVVVVHEP
ncbi:hypothetical protein Mapa_011886 [Marchantia paleacea]|nr:hypothetical protein Mapa_011886 [Marchantia paleacea]